MTTAGCLTWKPGTPRLDRLPLLAHLIRTIPDCPETKRLQHRTGCPFFPRPVIRAGLSARRAPQSSRAKMPAEGLIVVPSDFDPEQTMNRLEAEVRARGMTVFARIDHSAGARSDIRPLRRTEVLIFGNPRDSALLVQADQQIGIDLPLRVLVYVDSDGNTWIAYYSPSWLAQRHGLAAQMTPSVSALTTMLEAVAAKVARLPSR